ncbi:MAG TPA: DinB family protein [Candidatus Limnocylindrales bacterium]|nr:DinB family protein [Candidatus Limnocylindrales bacterium]
MNPPAELASRLRSASADLAALEPATLEAGPWPLAPVFDTSDEAAWGPPEILAHVDEMLPYWLGEARRILETPAGEPAPFGRTAADDVRLALIARDRTVPLAELFDRASASADRVARRIEALSSADLERLGQHPVRGPLPVGEILDRFLVAHLEEHVRQLGDVLDRSGREPTA